MNYQELAARIQQENADLIDRIVADREDLCASFEAEYTEQVELAEVSEELADSAE
jgi:hypothetical protein